MHSKLLNAFYTFRRGTLNCGPHDLRQPSPSWHTAARAALEDLCAFTREAEQRQQSTSQEAIGARFGNLAWA